MPSLVAMARRRLLAWGLILAGTLALAGCVMPEAPVAAEPAVDATPPAPEAQAEPPPARAQPADDAVELAAFVLDSERSEARFIIEETLAGAHTVVTGVTSAVEGRLFTHPARVAATRIDPIVIDAATFATDSNMRNRAIRNFVLYTNLYPEIVFTPSALAGAPETVAIGEEFALAVTGALQLLDTVKDVTVPVTAVFRSATELAGSGSVTVVLEDYGVTVPMPPRVTWVADEIALELDFTAVAAPK